MTNPPPEEPFTEQRPTRSDFTRVRTYRIRRIITLVVLIGIIGGGGHWIYSFTRGPAVIPTIKAEGSFKQKPEQPGGLEIPNQDVLAYQQIDNSGEKTPVEHLLPPPEAPQPANEVKPTAPLVSTPTPETSPAIETLAAPQPVPVVTTVSPQKSQPPTAAATNVAPSPSAAPVSAVEQKVAEESVLPPASSLPPPPEETTSEPAKAAAAPETPAPAASPGAQSDKTTSKPAATGKKGFRVQLASFPDEDTAHHELTLMEARYASHLGGAQLHLTKADLGARGIYYRVQSNPITEGEARDICAALKNLKAGCIIVKP